MQTRRGIALLLWGAVAVLLLCDQAVAKDNEDSEPNSTEDQAVSAQAGEASPDKESAVAAPEGVTPAAFEKGDMDELQLGTPWDSAEDGIGAKAAPPGHKLILVADSGNGSITRLYTADDTNFRYGRFNINGARPIAVDYDPTDDMIYWTSVNGANSVVHRFPYNLGPGLRLDGQLASVPDGIAVDVISRNLYWTDTGIDRIMVSRLDGTFRKSLITVGLDEPRAIVVDPNSGWMYWTDWGVPSKIERARMDGTQRSVIVNIGLGDWPNGLALDAKANRLYWCNGGTNEIWSSGVTGTSPSPARLLTHTGAHLFGMAVDETYLYWTGWNKPGVHRINKNLQGYVTIRLDHFERLNDIHVQTSANTPTQPNACSVSNGNCAQLCLPVPGGGWSCACQDGLSLQSDGRSCGQIGPCVEACVPGGCPDGQACLSNGCGHTCQTVTTPSVSPTPTPCLPNPCLNGGRCQPGVNSYTCSCAYGFGGDNCETEILSTTVLPTYPTTSGFPTGTQSLCDAGWFHHEDKCYCLLEDQFTYSEAARSCAELDVYGQLAVVKRPSTHRFLMDYVERVGGGSPWIGIDDATTEGVWKYADGVLVGDPFNAWAEDTWNSKTKDCVRMSETFGYHWQPMPCSTQLPYVCEYPLLPPTQSPTPTPSVLRRCAADSCNKRGVCIDGLLSYTCYCLPGFEGDNCETDINECDPNPCQNGGTCTDGHLSYTCKCASGFGGANCNFTCPAGFRMFNSQCYWFSTGRKNVDAAERDCAARGARLASVKDQETHDFLRLTIALGNRRPYWIGLSDRVVEGMWRHSDGTLLGSFRPFRQSRNSNNGYKDCVVMWPASAYQWLYWSCRSSRNYICQKEAASP